MAREATTTAGAASCAPSAADAAASCSTRRRSAGRLDGAQPRDELPAPGSLRGDLRDEAALLGQERHRGVPRALGGVCRRLPPDSQGRRRCPLAAQPLGKGADVDDEPVLLLGTELELVVGGDEPCQAPRGVQCLDDAAETGCRAGVLVGRRELDAQVGGVPRERRLRGEHHHRRLTEHGGGVVGPLLGPTARSLGDPHLSAQVAQPRLRLGQPLGGRIQPRHGGQHPRVDLLEVLGRRVEPGLRTLPRLLGGPRRFARPRPRPPRAAVCSARAAARRADISRRRAPASRRRRARRPRRRVGRRCHAGRRRRRARRRRRPGRPPVRHGRRHAPAPRPRGGRRPAAGLPAPACPPRCRGPPLPAPRRPTPRRPSGAHGGPLRRSGRPPTPPTSSRATAARARGPPPRRLPGPDHVPRALPPLPRPPWTARRRAAAAGRPAGRRGGAGVRWGSAHGGL